MLTLTNWEIRNSPVIRAWLEMTLGILYGVDSKQCPTSRQ
jgi:hypothetical protein